MIKLKKNDLVLFVGDSITHGGKGNTMDLNHIMGHGFQSVAASKMAADNLDTMPKFYNKGISGDTSQNVYSRWGDDVIRYRPTIINLLVGVNDITKGLELTEEVFIEKYIGTMEMIIKDTYASLENVTMFICEPFYFDVRNQEAPYENIPHPFCEQPFSFANRVVDVERLAKIERRLSLVRDRLPRLAEKYGTTYIKLYDVFTEAAKKVPMSYLVWDNGHPTMVGHQLIAERWLEAAEPVINARK